MKIVVTKSASKDIQKIDKPLKKEIKQKIKNLQNFPNVINTKKLKNFAPAYRLRVGNYRVLFDFDDEKELIIVSRILHRKDAYK